jgi:hypothetical protein
MLNGTANSNIFTEEVTIQFSFLVTKGFRIVKHDKTLVRFESGQIFVNVYHGRKSYELGLEIGRHGDKAYQEECFSMSEILRVTEPDMAKAYRNYAAKDDARIKQGVRELALLLSRLVDAGLLDDRQLFTRLEKQRTDWKKGFAKKVQMAQMTPTLDLAWRAKDFDSVVRLLEPVQDELNSTQLMKLEYAKKQIEE